MENYWSDSFYRPPRPRRGVDHDFAPPPPQGAELDRFSGRWSHADPNPEGSNHDGQVIYAGPPPGPTRPKSPRARRRRGSTELVYIDEYVRHGSHRHAYGDREFQMTAEEEHQTTCDPDQPVNVHVQLQLPIALDLDDELGELARLRRVGDFRAAKSFFRSKLAEHIGNPYVFVQYAELLLAMEDYKALKSLRPPPSFGVSIEEEGLRRARREKGLNTEDGADPWLDLHPRAEGTLLFWNWSLIKSLVLIHADDCVYSVEWLRSTFSYLDFQDDLGSTEVQIIVLSIKLFVAAFKSASQLNHIGSLQSDFEHWVDWGSLFASLSRQNRHWDCCDLKAIDAIAFGYREHWNWQNNLPGRDRFDFDFTGPWEQLDHDEASLLACLDQTTSVTLAHFTAKPYVIDCIKKSANMLSMMNSAAELLKRHYPAAMRSRPFVRWLILSSQAAGEKSDELSSLEHGRSWWGVFHNLTVRPGCVTMGWSDGISLPIYIPRGTEVPKWEALENPQPINEALHLALNLARDMDDYPTQAICYKLLALRCKDPTPFLESLCRLQEAHGDRAEYLKTLLSSYIGLDDVRSAKRLLDKLTDFRDVFSVGAYNRADIEVHWAHDVIKRALLSRIDGRHHQDMLGWVDADYVRYLPKQAREFADEVRAERTSLVRQRDEPQRHYPRPPPVSDTRLQRAASASVDNRGGRPEERVANDGPFAGETLREKRERLRKQLTQLKAAREAEAARAAVAQKEDDNNFSTDRQYPRRIPSPDDSADQRWDDAAAKARQVILWKGDFRNHEQWLALNRGELDPEEYYRRWAARNPDAARAAWSSRPSLERERERRDAESDSCDSGDESSPVARVARRRWDSRSSSSDGEGSSWYPEHQYYPPPPITSEVVDRRDAPGIPPASKAPDSPTFTQGEKTAEPAEMATSKEPTWTWRQPTVISTAPAEVQRPSVPPDESATRSRRARVDDDSDSDAPPLTRGSQDYHPREPRIHSAPTSLHGNLGRYSSHRELDTTPGPADPVPERRYASPRAVRWEDHERRRQNDRIGNRAPSVVTSDGPSHALSAEASAPLTPVVRKQQRMEPGRRRPSVAVVPLPTEGMPRTAPRRGRPSVTIADPAVGSSTAVDAAGLAHAQAFEGGSLSSNRITLPNSRAHYDRDKKWWYCNCNPDLAASIRRVNKETKNKGRRFWTCSKDRSMSCDFFLWEDDACVVEARAEGQSPP
ncbi:hypothetical protein ACKVV1_005779 [Pyricularia oryzae]